MQRSHSADRTNHPVRNRNPVIGMVLFCKIIKVSDCLAEFRLPPLPDPKNKFKQTIDGLRQLFIQRVIYIFLHFHKQVVHYQIRLSYLLSPFLGKSRSISVIRLEVQLKIP